MPDEDKNFAGSLILNFRELRRHKKTIYCQDHARNGSEFRRKAPEVKNVLFLEKANCF